MKLITWHGGLHNKLNKFQPNNILFLENSWIEQKSLEKNITEHWVNENINLSMNNIKSILSDF